MYTIFKHFSACGGNLSSFAGKFASPFWPNTYPSNVECIWIIKASPGNSITITIRELDIEESDNCNNNYLEIRENNADGQLQGVYCGSSALQNHSEINTYWIKFKSGPSGISKGFLAEYSYITKNELIGESGVITSPLYPRQFLGDEVVIYRIIVEIGRVVFISFENFRFSSKLNGICVAFIKVGN